MNLKEKRKLKKQCDLLWSQIIKSKGVCEWCGQKTNWLNSAHINSRRFLATRWDLDNGICLCAGCHRKAHDRPLEFAQFVFGKLGTKKYNELKQKSNILKPKIDLEKIYKNLEGRWKVVGNQNQDKI